MTPDKSNLIDFIARCEITIMGGRVGMFDVSQTRYQAPLTYKHFVPALRNLSDADIDTVMSDVNMTESYYSVTGIDGVADCLKSHPEAYRALAQVAAGASAFSLADKIGATFLHEEAMRFRVAVQLGEKHMTEVSGGRVVITLSPDMIESTKGVTYAVDSATYGVLASHYMHDVEIRKMLAEGDEDKAAAFAAMSRAFLCRIAQNGTDTGSYGFLQGIAGATNNINIHNGGIGWDAKQALKGNNVSVSRDPSMYFRTVGGMVDTAMSELRDYTDGSNKEMNITTLSADDSYDSAMEKTENYKLLHATAQKLAIRGLSRAASAFAEYVKLARKFDDEDDGSDGNGIGAAAAHMIAQVVGDAGAGQGDQPGDGEGDQEAQGSGQEGDEGPTDDDRKEALWRDGNYASARDIMEFLGLDEQKALADDTPVNWTDHLHHSLLKSMGIDRVSSWARPNRRFIGSGIYLPGFKRKKVRRIALAIDESGSIDMEKLMKFNEEIIRVIDVLNPEGVDVFHFSTDVREETLTQGEIWEAKRLLNGGTDFSKCYGAIQEHLNGNEWYDAVIFFTDLEDTGYRGLKTAVREQYIPAEIDFYWVAFGGCRQKPEFGTLINMDTGEIEEFGNA